MVGLKYIIILYAKFFKFLLTGTFHSKRYDNSLIRKNAFNLTDLRYLNISKTYTYHMFKRTINLLI